MRLCVKKLDMLSWNLAYTLKARARATFHAVTFKIYTSLITKSLIEGVLYLLNMLPYKYEVLDTLSPSTIVEGIPKVDLGYKMIAFGSYVMVHIGTTDTVKIRCIPVIVLKAPKYYGGYYFMNIFTGENA